jgi:polyvinyl alcohol dehydrogenase (cytochrome)
VKRRRESSFWNAAARIVSITLCLGTAASHAQHQLTAPGGADAAAPGAEVYNGLCITCHGREGVAGADQRAPRWETLRQYPPERLLDALNTGKMQAQASSLDATQRRDVSEWVAGRKLGSLPLLAPENMPNQCRSPGAPGAESGWNGWGRDSSNSRYQSGREAGLNARNVRRLKLKWAFGLPGGAQVASQPAVVGGRLYIGSDAGHVYSLDAKSGCVHWAYKAESAVRTAPLVAPLNDNSGALAVFVGDLRGKVYAIDAASGRLVWSTQVDQTPSLRIMGTPAVYGGRVFVGVSSGEEGALGQKDYECCRFRGSVTALDSTSGRELWKTYVIDEPKPRLDPVTGARGWGPSGGGVWSPPTVDAKRRRIYVGTGNAYTSPAGPLNDSVLALDMDTGEIAWSRQDTPDDVWLFGCQDGVAGCAAKVGPDWDFAASVMLKQLPGGKDILVAAHKGGVALALDPDRHGAVVWRTNMAARHPSFYGDVLFGGAADSTRAYYALQETAAVVALNLSDGSRAWTQPIKAIEGRSERVGAGAAVTAIPGAVFSGSWDGMLRAYSAKDGKELWSFDTVRWYEPVNGVPARGGSMGGPGPTVANGMMYVGTGYVGVSNGLPGNALLAFGL